MRQSKYAPLATSVVLGAVLASQMAYAQTGQAQGQAQAQRQGQVARPATTSGTTAQELTRSLNSRPPAGAQAQPQPQTGSAPAPAPAQPATQATRPPVAPAASPAPATATAQTDAEAAPPAPPPVRLVPLNAAAIAALPFRIDLKGAQIFERPAGAGAKIYSVSRAGAPLLMIYAGPRSDYPIYDGEQATVAGRTSIILADGTSRRAVEHLFRREDKLPADIHIWLMATDGQSGALAEQIGQTVDPR